MNTTLGVDIAKRKFDVALLHDSKYKAGKFENNLTGFQQLLEWLAKTGTPAPHICLEASARIKDSVNITA